MNRLVRGLALGGLLLAALGMAGGQQTEPIFIGVLMGIHENGETRCDFVYRSWVENDIYVSVPEWCKTNIDLITAVNNQAREWLRANPIDDPEGLAYDQRAIEKLKKKGYEVKKDQE